MHTWLTKQTTFDQMDTFYSWWWYGSGSDQSKSPSNPLLRELHERFKHECIAERAGCRVDFDVPEQRQALANHLRRLLAETARETDSADQRARRLIFLCDQFVAHRDFIARSPRLHIAVRRKIEEIMDESDIDVKTQYRCMFPSGAFGK